MCIWFILWLIFFAFKAACCRNNKKREYVFYWFIVWNFLCDISNASSWYFHRYVKDTYFRQCDMYYMVKSQKKQNKTGKHPVCQVSFWVDPPVKTNKLYLSSYSWQRVSDTPKIHRNKNNMKTWQPFLKLLCSVLWKHYFSLDVGHRARLLSPSPGMATHAQLHILPLCSSALRFVPSIGSCHAFRACMGFFPGKAQGGLDNGGCCRLLK